MAKNKAILLVCLVYWTAWSILSCSGLTISSSATNDDIRSLRFNADQNSGKNKLVNLEHDKDFQLEEKNDKLNLVEESLRTHDVAIASTNDLQATRDLKGPSPSSEVVTPASSLPKESFSGVILRKGVSVPFNYAADPNALVVNGTIYVFCSNDPNNASARTRYSQMRGYVLLTTNSLAPSTHWINHGVVLRPALAFPLVKEFQNQLMFAPGAAYKDGWFYVYFPYLPNQDASSRVGVARSKTPAEEGSWTLVTAAIPGVQLFDPAVMQTINGEFYLYGNSRWRRESQTEHRLLGAPLASDMVSLDPTVTSMSPVMGGRVTEAVFAFWRRLPGTTTLIYYFIARVKTPTDDCIMYWMTKKGPMGVMPASDGDRLTPNQQDAPAHASVIEFHGNYYLFYHTGAENDGNQWRRSTCVDQIQFFPDGRMRQVHFSCRYRSKQ